MLASLAWPDWRTAPSTFPPITVHARISSLPKDAPTPRRVQASTDGDVIAFREVGGLHHRYERRIA